MPTVRLIAAHDEYSGRVGLLLKGMPNTGYYPVVALQGQVIAHDILEHIVEPATTMTFKGEQMAVGSSWYVRGSYGGYSRDNWQDPAVSIGQEMASLCAQMMMRQDQVYMREANVIDTIRFTGLYRDDVLEIRNHMLKYLRSELEDRDEVFSGKEIALAVTRSMQRFMIGLRAAIRRYKNQAEVNQLFWDMAEAIDPYTKRGQEGQEIELTYGITSGRVRVHEIEEEQW